MNRYEPIDIEEIIEVDFTDIERIDTGEMLFNDKDIMEIEERVIAKPEPELDLLEEFKNAIIRQAPHLRKRDIYSRMIRLKSWLFSLRLCYAKYYIAMKEIPDGDQRKEIFRRYLTHIRGEFRETVCKIMQLAIEAQDYYERTGEMRWIEELVDLYYYKIKHNGIPKYCVKTGSHDGRLILRLLHLSKTIGFTKPEWRDYIDKTNRIEKLLSLPRNRLEAMQLLK